MSNERYVAYVGTYTHGTSVGIHIYDLDVEGGSMAERKVIPINNPSHLTVSANGKFLYSIADEGVAAFKILPDGDLEAMNEKWIGGMRGCYVDVETEALGILQTEFSIQVWAEVLRSAITALM